MLKYLLLAALALSLNATAQLKNNYELNKDYYPLVKDIDNARGPKVIEFFWLGCNHCYDVEGDLNRWVKDGKAKGVEFEKIPAVPSDRWAPAGQFYYTLEELNKLDLVEPAFDAIHKDQQVKLAFDKGTMRKFVEEKGKVSGEDFDKAWDSDSVKQKMARAKKAFEDSQLDGVPVFVVNGQYQVHVDNDHEKLFRKLNTLAETTAKGGNSSPVEDTTKVATAKAEEKGEDGKAAEAKAEEPKASTTPEASATAEAKAEDGKAAEASAEAPKAEEVKGEAKAEPSATPTSESK